MYSGFNLLYTLRGVVPRCRIIVLEGVRRLSNPFSKEYDPKPYECEVCRYVSPDATRYFLHLQTKHPTGALARVLEPSLFSGNGNVQGGHDDAAVCRCSKCHRKRAVEVHTVA